MSNNMDPVVKMLVEKYTNEYVNQVQQYEWHIEKINEMVGRLNKEVEELREKQRPEMDHIHEQQEFICDSISDLQDQWLANIKSVARVEDMVTKEMQEFMRGVPGRMKDSPGCLHIAAQIANAKIQGEFVADDGSTEPTETREINGVQGVGSVIRMPGKMISDKVIKS